MDRYIDIVFDGPPSAESGRFVEVEDEDGHSISAGEWIGPDPTLFSAEQSWRLRLNLYPSLHQIATTINQNAIEHGFWPDRRVESEALSYLLDLAAFSSMGDDSKIDEAKQLIRQGFGPSRNMGEMLMLMVSELAEALEEHRDGKPAVYYKLTMITGQDISDESANIMSDLKDQFDIANLIGEDEDWHPQLEDEEWARLVKDGIAKPEGVAVELADAIIRELDTLKNVLKDLPYTVDDVVRMKMNYNATRDHMHGRKY